MKPVALWVRCSQAALFIAVLQGCAAPDAGLHSTPLPPLPVAFTEVEGRWVEVDPAHLPVDGEWWKAFGDPTLDALIAKAGRDNADLEVAAAQLTQSRALVRATRANQSPQLSAGTSVNRQTLTPLFGTTAPGTVLNAGVEASYEVDLFGRLARTTEAAALDADARAALLQQAQLLVQSDVAQLYFELRALDQDRRIVGQTLEAYRATLALVEKRYRAGDVAELDVARLRTEVLATASELVVLQRRRAEIEHGLAVLAGAFASGFSVSAADWLQEPPRIPPGVPMSVLIRRPDVAAAHATLSAARTRVGVARTAWFPDVSLSGSAGFASTDAGDLLRWSARAWGIGALLSLPLFDGGRRQAGVEVASAQWNAVAARYRQQVLTAVREVEDQLSALRFLDTEAALRGQAVDSARRAALLSTSRYRNGYVSQIELLDARRGELSNERMALQVRSAQFRSTVGLIRALGGGWQGTPSEGG